MSEKKPVSEQRRQQLRASYAKYWKEHGAEVNQRRREKRARELAILEAYARGELVNVAHDRKEGNET